MRGWSWFRIGASAPSTCSQNLANSDESNPRLRRATRMHGTFLNKGLRSVMGVLAMVSALLVPASVETSIGAASKLNVLRLDYAYYNPVSLILRRMQWVEQDFARDGTRVEWVLSLGRNKANEY